MPGISAALQAKSSACSFKQASSCLFTKSGSPAPILIPFEGSSPKEIISNSPSGIGRKTSLSSWSSSLRSFLLVRASRSIESPFSTVLTAGILCSAFFFFGVASVFMFFAAASKHLLAATISPFRVAYFPSTV
ncbi:hypothetical protein QL285_053610 [Trifolium repens]|nr:hypothetical protein QL285_053610 [Trifolium repens]